MFIICVGKPIKYISFNYICREGINGLQIAIHFLKFTVFEDLKTQFFAIWNSQDSYQENDKYIKSFFMYQV